MLNHAAFGYLLMYAINATKQEVLVNRVYNVGSDPNFTCFIRVLA